MATLTSLWPSFIVANLTASISFYVDKLGFEVQHIGPDGDPYWAIVGRDKISIMLKAVAAEINPSQITGATPIHLGTLIFSLPIRAGCLMSIIPSRSRFTNLYMTTAITSGALK